MSDEEKETDDEENYPITKRKEKSIFRIAKKTDDESKDDKDEEQK